MGLYSYSTLEVIISQYSYYGFIAGSCWKNMFPDGDEKNSEQFIGISDGISDGVYQQQLMVLW